MRKTAKNRIWIAGLLIVLFTIPYVVKTTHIQIHCDINEEAGPEEHHCDDCPVCQFFYSSFVEAEIFEWTSFQKIISPEPVICPESGYSIPYFFNYQRGPPIFV